MKLKFKLNRIVPLLLVVGTGLLATGCGTTPSATNNTSSKTLFTLIRYQSMDPIKDVLDSYQSKYPQYSLAYNNLTFDNNYEFNSLKSIASLNGDIWEIPNNFIGDNASLFSPLPSNFYYVKGSSNIPVPAQEVTNLYPTGIAEQITSPSGEVYGLPTSVNSLILYYNQDLFKSALKSYRQSLGSNFSNTVYQPVAQLLSTPPATWSDLIQQTQYLNQRNGNNFNSSAIALGTADNIPNSNQILQLLMMQDGANIISRDHKSVLFNDINRTVVGSTVVPGEKALEFYTSFSDPTKANYSWNNNMENALDAFGQGKVAMVIAFGDFSNQLNQKYPNFNFGITAVPQIYSNSPQNNVNLIQFTLEGVTQTSQNQTLGFRILNAYTDPKHASNIASAQANYSLSPYLSSLNSIANSNQNINFMAQQVLTGKAVYEIDRPQFEADFRQMIVDVSQNNVSPGVALDSAAQKINAILANAATQ
jgi:ABC-type glycerol-3-phosphate transport system substrate-binding protein